MAVYSENLCRFGHARIEGDHDGSDVLRRREVQCVTGTEACIHMTAQSLGKMKMPRVQVEPRQSLVHEPREEKAGLLVSLRRNLACPHFERQRG